MNDRELDVLVAEKVMNFMRVGSMWTPRQWTEPAVMPSGYISTRPCYYDWSPSTSIVAAWQVVEKIPSDLKLTGPHGDKDESWVWIAAFDYNQFVAGAKTAPRAICLAALKAVGVEMK